MRGRWSREGCLAPVRSEGACSRWKVACINWSHADAPHAVSYLWDGAEMRAEHYATTWGEAMARVNRIVTRASGAPAPGGEDPRECPVHGDWSWSPYPVCPLHDPYSTLPAPAAREDTDTKPEAGPALATAEDVIAGRAHYADTPGGHVDRATRAREARENTPEVDRG